MKWSGEGDGAREKRIIRRDIEEGSSQILRLKENFSNDYFFKSIAICIKNKKVKGHKRRIGLAIKSRRIKS